MNASLYGRHIAVPESRELDLLSQMLEERSAIVFRCPLVSIRDASDRDAVHAWIRRQTEEPPPVFILYTGEGVRRLLDAAAQVGLRDELISAMDGATLVTRGPKPVRALRDVGLRADAPAAPPTTPGVIDTVSRLDLAGRRVAVQLYGQEPNRPLVDALETAGATVDTVAPYEYVDDTAEPGVVELIQGLRDGRFDAIMFTSKAQVERLFAVAAAQSLTDALHAGLERTVVAAVGPVVTASLEEHGGSADLQPERSYFMKPLVRELEAKLGRKG